MEFEKLSREQQLILACSRIHTHSISGEIAGTLLNDKLNWEYILEYATKNGIAPLIYKYINAASLKHSVPVQIYEKLRNSYFHTFSKNTRLFDDFSAILRSFEIEGIQCVLLKGIVLAEFVYQDIGLRPMDDIDILVREEDLDTAHQILLDNGFVSSLIVKSKFIGQYVKSHHLPPYRKGSSTIEVHRHIQTERSSHQININEIWSRAVPLQMGINRVLVPDDSDMLIHLITHLDTHFSYSGFRFGGFCDIAEFIKFRNINWDSVLLFAERYNVSSLLLNYVSLVSTGFEIKLPSGISSKLQNNRDLESRFLALIQNKDFHTNDRNFNLEQLSEVKGLGNKLKYLAGDLFPSPKFIMLRFGLKQNWKAYFYYPVRIIIGIKNFIRYKIKH